MYFHKLPNAAASNITVTSTATNLYDLIETAAGTTLNLRKNLNGILLLPEDGDVRFLLDGNSPTATEGILVKSGQPRLLEGVPLNQMELIRTGASNVKVSIQVGESEIDD